MARVSSEEVKQVIETKLLDISTFIDSAHIFMETRLSSKGLDEELLKRIELYIAAHFICISERRSAIDSLGDAEVTYEGKTGYNLDYTPYGQTAKLLDSSNTLSLLSTYQSAGYGEVEFI